MKKLLSILFLSAFALNLSVGIANAKEFVDYGVNSQGQQCFDEKDAKGECNLVHSKGFTTIGDNGANLTEVVLAQPMSDLYDAFFEKHCTYLISVSAYFGKNYVSGYCADRGYEWK